MDGTVVATNTSPYELIGGAEGVKRLVDAFYAAMDHNPAYADLRNMHEPDLGPTREALAGFLTVWLGGPREWIEKRGGFCIMSRHAQMNITEATAGQWMDAMRDAMREVGVEPELAKKMEQALGQLAEAMAWRGKTRTPKG
jgi:hemoglobin